MNEKRRRWVLLVVFVVALATVGGVVVEQLSRGPLEERAPAVEEALTAVEATPQTNKVVLEETTPSADEVYKTVSGKVVSVNDRVLVLEAGGDRLQILVALDAKISRIVLPPDSRTPQVTEIGLEEVQNGQRVDAWVEVEGGRALATNLNVIVVP